MPMPRLSSLLRRLMPVGRSSTEATLDLWAALAALEEERARDRFNASDWNDPELWSSRARQALGRMRRAARQGADLYAPRQDKGPMSTGHDQQSGKSLAEAETPMEWALSHQQWTATKVLLEMGVDPNRVGEVPVPWTRGKSEALAHGFEQASLTVPYAVRAMLGVMEAANRPNGLVPDAAWGVLEAMVDRGARFDWADSTGSSLGMQVMTAWRRPEHLPNAWWSRLNPARCDRWGRNLLHYWQPTADAIELFGRLVDLGADPYREDHQGRSPLLMLAQVQPTRVRDVLVQKLAHTHPDLTWHRPTRLGESPLNVLASTPLHERSAVFDAFVQALRARAVMDEQATLASVMNENHPNRTSTVLPDAVPEIQPSRARL